LKTKEEILEINKEQKAFYNQESAFAKPNFFSRAWRNFRNGPLNSYQKTYNLRARMYQMHKDWMGDLSQKKVLDLGCLRGNALSLFLAENAKEYVGIDLSDIATQDLQNKMDSLGYSNARAVAVDFLSDDFKDKNFDIIYAFGVLHHFENFDVLMERLVEKLKPNGEVISFDPLETSLPVVILRKLYRPFQQDKDWEWPFNKKTFTKISNYFEINELRGVLGKSKYGLLLHVLPFNEQTKSKKIESFIASDWKNQSYKDVVNCMQVTMRLKVKTKHE
jgi:2-polyprenyl-3-methyl-5-hydroxy-6-metoxy-1,4-benzoquinol methylase